MPVDCTGSAGEGEQQEDPSRAAGSSDGSVALDRRDDRIDLSIGHLSVKRQTNTLVARAFAFGKMLHAKPCRVTRLPVNRHNPAARGNAVIEQALHESVTRGRGRRWKS